MKNREKTKGPDKELIIAESTVNGPYEEVNNASEASFELRKCSDSQSGPATTVSI